MAEGPPEKPASDVVLLHSPTEDGKGARVLRLRDDAVEAGEVRPLEDGKPIQGEVVSLRPRADAAHVCDVDVVVPRKVAPPSPEIDASRKGPAQVATTEYRGNWDRIFGGKATLN